MGSLADGLHQLLSDLAEAHGIEYPDKQAGATPDAATKPVSPSAVTTKPDSDPVITADERKLINSLRTWTTDKLAQTAAREMPPTTLRGLAWRAKRDNPPIPDTVRALAAQQQKIESELARTRAHVLSQSNEELARMQQVAETV